MTSASSYIRISITPISPGEMGRNRIKVRSQWMMILWQFWCSCNAIKNFGSAGQFAGVSGFLAFEKLCRLVLMTSKLLVMCGGSWLRGQDAARTATATGTFPSASDSVPPAAAPQWSQFTWWLPLNVLDCNRVFFNFSRQLLKIEAPAQSWDLGCRIFNEQVLIYWKI